jgi:putative DNA primase/helicase
MTKPDYNPVAKIITRLQAQPATIAELAPLDPAAEALGRKGRELAKAEAAKANAKAEASAPPPKPEAPKAKAPPDPDHGFLWLDPHAPLDNARKFAQRCCYRDGDPEVWFWQDQFWRWNGQHYAPYSKEEIRGQVYTFLDGAYRKNVENTAIRFRPGKHHVEDLLDALRSCLALNADYVPPMWLDGAEPARDWVVFRNGVVNVTTCEVRPLTHRLWAHSGLEFDWDNDAECPVWDRFLEDLFPGDPESQEFLEEFIGYCMTGDTKFEKAAMLIGPRRSGKSTIVYLVGRLVGDGAYVGLSFNDWLSSAKATQVLIGKRVVAFPDVRLKPGKMYGKNYDPGGIDHRSSELLLKITGRDKVSIGQMYAEAWNGVLQAKVIITSNEVPNFNDTSGVLPTRFIKLQFRRSFAGHEDVNLRSKLTAELPGIAAYCVGAYQRLCERGHFVQPASAAELEREVLAKSDPFTAMALECFIRDPAGMVSRGAAFARFERWCNDNGRTDLLLTTRRRNFGEKLRAVPGFENLTAYRPHGEDRHWVGISLRKSR